MDDARISLRPGVTNLNEWYPVRPKPYEWEKIRKTILLRDNYTCASCGHRALKWMNIHHLTDADSTDPSNLCTLCVACHAVMHMGLNLQLGKIAIYKSPMSQVDIVRRTRDGVSRGMTLEAINATFNLKRGRRAPESLEWANSLIRKMGPEPRAELPEPLCAVFIDFRQWQIEP